MTAIPYLETVCNRPIFFYKDLGIFRNEFFITSDLGNCRNDT
jgi:hypothetical protein